MCLYLQRKSLEDFALDAQVEQGAVGRGQVADMLVEDGVASTVSQLCQEFHREKTRFRMLRAQSLFFSISTKQLMIPS